MTGSCIISGSHLAIECDGNRIYPDARFVYSVFRSSEDSFVYAGINVPNIQSSIPQLGYSRFGSEIRCRFASNGGELTCEVYTCREGISVPLKYSGGKIVDHAILEDEWFFVSGDVQMSVLDKICFIQYY